MPGIELGWYTSDATMLFRDRDHAGELLAKQLESVIDDEDVVVVAIPRGGVVVGKVVADRFNAPLDVVIVEKLGAPGNEEFAVGAIGPEDQLILDNGLIDRLGIPQSYINKIIGQEGIELEMKERTYRQVTSRVDVENKTVVIVDDGIATGSTMEVAIKAIQKRHPKKIVLAVPVAPKEAVEKLESLVNELFFLVVPSPFLAVGQFYEEFEQVETSEAIALLLENN